MKNSEIVYIRSIEGVLTFVPAEGRVVNDNVFEILESDIFDLEDATCVYEFYPGDKVECERNGRVDNHWLAKKMRSSAFPKRKLYELLWKILESEAKISPKELPNFNKEIKELCSENSKILQKKHPGIQEWIHKNCS